MGIKSLVGDPEVNSSDEQKIDSRPFYYDFIEQGIRSHSGRGKGLFFHPSFYCSCERGMVLNLLGYPSNPADLAGIKRMDSGTFVHEKWEKYFKQSGLLFSTKHRIRTTDPPFSGEPDFVVLNHKTMKLFQVEIKSREFYAFGKQEAALPGNVRQWQIYSWMIEQFYNTECKEGVWIPEEIPKEILEGGWIHYEDMNLQRWKAFPLLRDDCWLETELAKYRKWYAMATNNIIPVVECDQKKEKKFKWCPMSKSCLALSVK